MPIDPRELAIMRGVTPGAGADGEPVVTCPKCGYDRAGLPLNAVCPECGAPPRQKFKSAQERDNLVDAPPVYLRNLGLGFALMALGMVDCIFSLFPTGLPLIARAASGFCGAMMWWLGTFIVTGPRRSAVVPWAETRRERRILRRMNRSMQAGWLVYWAGAVALAGLILGPGTTKFIEVVGTIAMWIGLAGLPLLCAQLCDLSDWASDDSMSDRLRASAGLIMVGGATILLSPLFGMLMPMLRGMLWTLEFLLSGLMIVGVIFFVICAIQMLNLVSWARRNAASRSGRDDRMREKAAAAEESRQREEARIRAEIAFRDAQLARRSAEPAWSDVSAMRPAERPSGPQPGSHTHRIAESDQSPYEIEP